MTKLAKFQNAHLAKPYAAPAKPITLKQVAILDTGDGAYIDQSVKVKPHRKDARKLVLKCVDLKRLTAAVTGLKLTPCGAPVRGSKHWVVIVWKTGFSDALLAQGSPQAHGMLAQGTPGQKVPTTKQITAKVLK